MTMSAAYKMIDGYALSRECVVHLKSARSFFDHGRRCSSWNGTSVLLFTVLACGALWELGKSTYGKLQSSAFFRFALDNGTQNELNLLIQHVTIGNANKVVLSKRR
jgi:hypothetical protein